MNVDNNLTEPFKCGPIRAHHIKYGIGVPLVIIEADTSDGDYAEVSLTMDEAKAMLEWLGRAVNQGEQR